MIGGAIKRRAQRVPRLAELDATSSTSAASGSAPSASSPSRSTGSSASARRSSTGILKFIKDAILMPLAKLAEGTRGYDLLQRRARQEPDHRRAGAAHRRDADRRLHEADRPGRGLGEHARRPTRSPRAWAWFQGALAALMGFVDADPGAVRRRAASRSRSSTSSSSPRAFAKVGGVFGGFVGQFISWGRQRRLEPARDHLRRRQPRRARLHQEDRRRAQEHPQEPAAVRRQPGQGGQARLPELRRATSSTHLKAGLIDWLTGSLPGVYIPKALLARRRSSSSSSRCSGSPGRTSARSS